MNRKNNLITDKGIKNILCKSLHECDIGVVEEKAEKLLSYMKLILEMNEHINLTRIIEPEDFLNKHFLDSLEITMTEPYRSAGVVLDVGTGAGVPGLILAVVSPDKSFVLLDSRNKKLKVLREISEELGIKNIELLHARAEEAQKKAEYFEAFDLVVARAVGSMLKVLDWTAPFAKKERFTALYKGPKGGEELSEAEKSVKKNGLTLKDVHKSSLTNQNHEIFLFKKEK